MRFVSVPEKPCSLNSSAAASSNRVRVSAGGSGRARRSAPVLATTQRTRRNLGERVRLFEERRMSGVERGRADARCASGRWQADTLRSGITRSRFAHATQIGTSSWAAIARMSAVGSPKLAHASRSTVRRGYARATIRRRCFAAVRSRQHEPVVQRERVWIPPGAPFARREEPLEQPTERGDRTIYIDETAGIAQHDAPHRIRAASRIAAAPPMELPMMIGASMPSCASARAMKSA